MRTNRRRCILAVLFGSVKIVEILLEKGAEMEGVDKEKQTPLTLAEKSGNEWLIKLFIVQVGSEHYPGQMRHKTGVKFGLAEKRYNLLTRVASPPLEFSFWKGGVLIFLVNP